MLYYFQLCVCVCLCGGYVHKYRCQMVQEVLHFSGVGITGLVSHLTWVLETKFTSSVRIMYALNH